VIQAGGDAQGVLCRRVAEGRGDADKIPHRAGPGVDRRKGEGVGLVDEIGGPTPLPRQKSRRSAPADLEIYPSPTLRRISLGRRPRAARAEIPGELDARSRLAAATIHLKAP
jgi:hypothetical protein